MNFMGLFILLCSSDPLAYLKGEVCVTLWSPSKRDWSASKHGVKAVLEILNGGYPSILE